jgi:hypothetical protein
MHCDTIRELFDDVEGRRVGACLDAEVREHLAECPSCQSAYAHHRELTAALRDLPSPALPADLVARIDRRLEDGAPPPQRVRRASPGRGALAAGFVATALFSTFLALALPWIFRGSDGTPFPAGRESVATSPAPMVAEIGGVEDASGLTATVMMGRSCLPSSDPLRVAQGKEMDVTVSLNSLRPVENAKVHVVLPQGLSFSPKAHPDRKDKKVLTLHDDLPGGDKDFRFRVKGARVGKWKVVAVVEAGDSVVVSDASIEVSSDVDDEETL